MLRVKMDAPVARDIPVMPGRAGKWEQRRVECATTDVLMTDVSGEAAPQAERKFSIDSGIGSTNSIELVGRSDARLIARGLERTYQELVACPAQLKYLLAARQAIAGQTPATCSLSHLTKGMAEAAGRILAWCEQAAVVPIPEDLVTRIRQSHRLRLVSDDLTHQVDRKCTAGNLKKALRKNEQLTSFNLHQLRPAQLEYDRTLYALIDQQPAVHELRSYLQSIRALLPDDVDMHAPVDTAVCTWAYNILLERARAAAGFHY